MCVCVCEEANQYMRTHIAYVVCEMRTHRGHIEGERLPVKEEPAYADTDIAFVACGLRTQHTHTQTRERERDLTTLAKGSHHQSL